MKYITGKNLDNLRNLLNESPLYYPIIMGILDGTFKGHALTNNTQNPNKALIFHKYIGLLLYIGRNPTHAEAVELAEETLEYKSAHDYCNVVEFAHYPEAIAGIIEKKPGEIKRYNRISWEHDLQLFNEAPQPKLDDNTVISLMQNNHFNNTFVRQECEMFWDTYEVFLKKVFGTIAHNKNGEFMGVCGACSDSGGFYEINI